MKDLRKNIMIILGASALFIILFLSIILPLNNHQRAKVSNGIVDLSNYDFTKNKTVMLNGEWELYKNKLLTPTEILNEKFLKSDIVSIPREFTRANIQYDSIKDSTLRLRIKVPDNPNNYGIIINNIPKKYKLWVNNTPVYSRVYIDNLLYEDKVEKNSLEKLNYDSQYLELVLQVNDAQNLNGGISNLRIGLKYNIKVISDIELASYIFMLGATVMIAFYNLYLYIMIKKDRSLLYCGLFCLAFAAKIVYIIERYLAHLNLYINQDIIIRISWISKYLSIFCILLLLREMYPKQVPQKMVKFYSVFTGIYILTAVIGSSNFYSSFYLYLIYLIVTVVASAKMLEYLWKALLANEEGISYILIGELILNLAAINDILYYNGIIFSIETVHYAYFLLILLYSCLLIKRISGYFHSVENMSIKLAKLDKIKDEFLANTSHELKTPLNGIINISESLLEGSSGALNNEQEKNIEIVADSGKRLSRLVDEILDFSKMKNSDIVLNKSSIDLKRLVDIMLQVFKHFIKDKPLNIVNNIPDNIDFVHGDEHRLKQIFYNLLGNAVKFTEEGEIRIYAKQKGNMIEITVEDTGVGIKEDKLQSIFEPFEQVENINSKVYEGVGLGLNITKGLVELHGGSIAVESVYGMGSKFIFTLPSTKNNSIKEHNINKISRYESIIQKKSETIIKQKISGSGEFVILVVDDEPANIQVLINILAMENYSVISALNGKEALEIIEENKKIDLVVLDLMMPNMSGYEVCSIVREKYSSFQLPILMLTAKNHKEDMIAGFEVGVNDFLYKPFDKNEIKARIRTLLELKKSAQKVIASEMAFMQAQIKPHFLHNALNTIEALCHIDVDRASEMIIYLSEYLRRSFDFKNLDKFIAIDNEMSLVQSYLVIEKERFGSRLNVTYDIDESINLKIPPLIIQPLVENAVKHGIFRKEHGGTINISIVKEDKFVIIRVEDDGVGMSDEKLRSLFDLNYETTGIGIKNVNSRLISIYGYGLDISTKAGKGTKVTIKIPRK